MKEFQEKRKFKKIIYSTSFQIVFGMLVLFLIFSTIKAYKKSERSADKTKETRKEILVLEKETPSCWRMWRVWKAIPAKKAR